MSKDGSERGVESSGHQHWSEDGSEERWLGVKMPYR